MTGKGNTKTAGPLTAVALVVCGRCSRASEVTWGSSPEKILLHYGFDRWTEPADREAGDLGLGMYGVRFPAGALAAATTIEFTRRFDGGWEGTDYTIRLD